MKEILDLIVFHLLQELETPKTFKNHANKASHNLNLTTIFETQDIGNLLFLTNREASGK